MSFMQTYQLDKKTGWRASVIAALRTLTAPLWRREIETAKLIGELRNMEQSGAGITAKLIQPRFAAEWLAESMKELMGSSPYAAAMAFDLADGMDIHVVVSRGEGRTLAQQLEEADRRIGSQASHMAAYAKCLDGLLANGGAEIPGSGMDGARNAGDIRAVAQHLIAKLEAKATSKHVHHEDL